MTTVVRNDRLARIAGAAGIVAQVAAAYYFVLFPALVVPSPINYLFVAAWFVLVGLAIAWWRHHPWRSLLVPVVSVPVVIVLLELGVRYLGWAP
ncbi:MAG: hypothetical protein M3R57_07755 [Chloroflexota bacterium]|nr:hypothetical protein [Chloroflexota bacterium]